MPEVMAIAAPHGHIVKFRCLATYSCNWGVLQFHQPTYLSHHLCSFGPLPSCPLHLSWPSPSTCSCCWQGVPSPAAGLGCDWLCTSRKGGGEPKAVFFFLFQSTKQAAPPPRSTLRLGHLGAQWFKSCFLFPFFMQYKASPSPTKHWGWECLICSRSKKMAKAVWDDRARGGKGERDWAGIAVASWDMANTPEPHSFRSACWHSRQGAGQPKRQVERIGCLATIQNYLDSTFWQSPIPSSHVTTYQVLSLMAICSFPQSHNCSSAKTAGDSLVGSLCSDSWSTPIAPFPKSLILSHSSLSHPTCGLTAEHSPLKTIWKLQPVDNTMMQTLKGIRWYTHMTPLLLAQH